MAGAWCVLQAMIDRLIRKNEASVTNGSSKLKSVYHSTRVQASGDSISSIGGSGITQRLSLGTSPKGGAGHMDAAKGNALHADSTTQASSKGAPLHTEPGAAKGGTVNVAAAAAAAASPFNKILMIPTAPLTATQSSASDEAAGSSTGAQLPPRPSVGAGKSRRGSVDMSMVLKANFSCPGGSTGQQQPAAGALRMVGSVCASPSASEPLTLLAPRVPSLTAKSRRNSVDMSGVSAVIQGAMSRLAVADPQSDLAIQPSMSSFTAGTDGGSGARLPIWLTDANASNASAGSMGGNESYLPLNYWKGGGDVAASAGSGNGKEVAAGRRAAGIDRHVLMSVPASGSVSPAPRNGRRAPVLMA